MTVFPFIIQEQLLSSSFCKILGWSILIQSFAKFIMGDILADTAILSNASKKELLCSCYEHTSRACLQRDGMAAEKEGFVWQENLSTCNYSWRTVLSSRLLCHCNVFSCTVNSDAFEILPRKASSFQLGEQCVLRRPVLVLSCTSQVVSVKHILSQIKVFWLDLRVVFIM